MIDLSAFMWVLAIFFGMIGYLRGWNRELVATAAIILTLFTLFRFDSLLRSIFPGMGPAQVFFVQIVTFMVIVFIVYNARELRINVRGRNIQSGILGIVVGALNGYLIGGSLWYFLDINEYPLTQFIIPPTINSPSAAAVGWIPMVIMGGGASGSGDIMSIIVIILLFFVLSSI